MQSQTEFYFTSNLSRNNAHKWLIYVHPCPLYFLLQLSFHNNKFCISFLISIEYQQFYNFPSLANGKWGTQRNKKHNHNIIMQSRTWEIVEKREEKMRWMKMLANVNGICVTFECCNKLKLNYTITIFKCKKSIETKRKNVLFTRELFHISIMVN